jgi:hypothetical protein
MHANSVVVLHPHEYTESEVLALSADMQVGYGCSDYDGGTGGGTGFGAPYDYSALTWHGAPGSAEVLNPGKAPYGFAYAISGSNRAGMSNDHAMLWRGPAGTAVDLNPADYDRSEVNSISGCASGLWCSFPGHKRRWSDCPCPSVARICASVVDLSPPAFPDSSCTAVSTSSHGTRQQQKHCVERSRVHLTRYRHQRSRLEPCWGYRKRRPWR